MLVKRQFVGTFMCNVYKFMKCRRWQIGHICASKHDFKTFFPDLFIKRIVGI